MKNDYLVEKKPLPALTLFVIPLMLGNMFQQLYNLADSAIVGQFVGEQAVAAVGACLALTNLFLFFANGGSVGASVLVGRHFGAKDYRAMQTTAFTALLTMLALSAVLGTVGFFLGKSFLLLLKTPADVVPFAQTYLKIYFLGLPFIFLYNCCSALFNALGKSRYPLLFLTISSVLNVALDLLFVGMLRRGIAGVAWATLISQAVAGLFSFAMFMRLLAGLSIGRTEPFSKQEAARIFKIALPSILQQVTISLGLLLIQSCVNRFGSQALAGYAVGSRIEALGTTAMISCSTAISMYVAQNLGAGKTERIPQGFRAANTIVLVFCVVFFIVIRLFKSAIILFFLGKDCSDMAFSTANGYLSYMSVVLCIMGFKQVSDGVLRGARLMKFFTVASLVNMALRVAYPNIFAPYFGISTVWIANPIDWTASLSIALYAYKKGLWKQQ